MKITFRCIENGGFAGKYDLPGFGCTVYVNADGNIVTIDVVDEKEDYINQAIKEEREENEKLGSIDMPHDLYEEMTDEDYLREFGMDELDDVLVNIDDDFDADIDEDETEYELETTENEEEDDDIENTFEYELIKSIQKEDTSGTVIKFLQELLEELNVRDENGALKTEPFMKLLHDIIDFTSTKEDN